MSKSYGKGGPSGPHEGDHDSNAHEFRDQRLKEADELDYAVAKTIQATATPRLDVVFLNLTKAATFSGLWFATAALMALIGGRRGRRAAARGLVAIGASSVIADFLAKLLFPRQRPDRDARAPSRRARMPVSSSFPSGHATSAFAFVTAVADDFPVVALPMYALASGVAYSRVHTGVHYPSDAIGGAVLGLSIGTMVRVATRGKLAAIEESWAAR